MEVYVTTGSNPFVPGAHLDVFASRAGADRAAARFANIIRQGSLADCPDVPKAKPGTWEVTMKSLAEHSGADDCWVDVSEYDVKP